MGQSRADVDVFKAQVEAFTTWLSRAGRPRHWSGVQVVEVQLRDGDVTHPDQPRIAADAFGDRWSAIVATVSRDWVNISGCGVDGRDLVLAVEWFSGNDRPDEISVVFSGHADGFRWPWN
jgi:hypothetical protein